MTAGVNHMVRSTGSCGDASHLLLMQRIASSHRKSDASFAQIRFEKKRVYPYFRINSTVCENPDANKSLLV